MLILDSDHVTEVVRNSAKGKALIDLLARAGEPMAMTIVSAEEQLRGWLALIKKFHDPFRQIEPYRRLQLMLSMYSEWTVLPWDGVAADKLKELRRRRIRIGTKDLKIASIVLAHNATLLSRNLGDYSQISEIRTENWL